MFSYETGGQKLPHELLEYPTFRFTNEMQRLMLKVPLLKVSLEPASARAARPNRCHWSALS